MRNGHFLTLLALFCALSLCGADDNPPAPTEGKPVVTQTWIDKLKKDLLLNYDRNVRPTQYYNVTNVDVKMTIRHVDIDEDNSIFSVYGWFRMNFTDLRLSWQPSDYGGVSHFYIPSYYLWDPELSIHTPSLESVGSSKYSLFSDIRVESTGQQRFTSRMHIKTICEMNFRKWPFDTQNCKVILGKSVSVREEHAIKLSGEPADMEELKDASDNPTWELVSVSLEPFEDAIEEDGRTLVGVQYALAVRRRVTIFQSTVIAPAVVFILMTLTSFWLPPNASEKILLNCINAVLVCIFLLYFTNHLPLLATRTPLVVLFFSNSLYLTALCMIMSVVVVNLARSEHRKPVHPYIKALIELPGISILVWSGTSTKTVVEDEEWTDEMKTESMPRESCSSADEASQGQANVQHDWIRFSVALERIGFILYVFIYSIMAACYLN